MYADAGTVHARADAGGPRCAATARRFRCSRARGSSDRCGWRASGGDDLATSRLEIRFFGAASKRHSVTQRFLRCYLVFRTLAGDWGIAVEGGRACGFEGENLREADGKRARLSVLLLFGQVRTNVDEIVGDDAEPDPALHAVKSFVAATIQPVSLFENADAAFASRSEEHT